MKKFFSILIVLILALSLATPALAFDDDMLWFVNDWAETIDDEREAEFEAEADSMSRTYNVGVYVVIIDSFDEFGSSEKAACQNLHTDYSLGYGAEGDAILMVLAIGDRRCYIQDFGTEGQRLLTDAGRELLEEVAKPYFSDDDWAGGIDEYLGQLESILRIGSDDSEPYGYEGSYYDGEESSTFLENAPIGYGIGLFAGVVIALIVCTIFKSQMKTAVKATSADHYVAPGGVEITLREDVFTHTTRTERRIHRDNDSSDGGSDGDSGGGFSF